MEKGSAAPPPAIEWVETAPIHPNLVEEFRSLEEFRISTSDGSPFTVTGKLGEVELKTERPGFLEGILGPGSGISVADSSGRGVTIYRADQDRIGHCPYPEGNSAPVFFHDLKAPVGELLAGVPDGWWKTCAALHGRQPDTLSQAMCAAVIRRFRTLASSPRANRERLEGMLRGENPPDEAVDRWIAGLREEEVRTIEDLAIGEASRMEDALRDLDADLDPEDPLWLRRWTEFCENRDDLQAIRTLLSLRGMGTRLRTALESLDDQAELFLAGLPRGLPVDSIRLRSITGLEPGAWWTQCARETREADA
ncbi:hypothetical protein KBD49_09660 [Myxococcota bacterium]|nr:hypothetical protein [Myxococcota bacterium]